MKLKPDDNTLALKDIVFDILQGKVKQFTASFDGSGDSGQIEDIDLEDAILDIKVEGVKIPNGIQYSQEGTKQLWDEAKTLRDVIDSVCYESLEEACSGWEINDGSYGEFVFDVKNRKVTLDFNERITDVRSSTYEF